MHTSLSIWRAHQKKSVEKDLHDCIHFRSNPLLALVVTCRWKGNPPHAQKTHKAIHTIFPPSTNHPDALHDNNYEIIQKKVDMHELEGLLIEKKQQQQQLMHLTGDVAGEFTEFAAATSNEVNMVGENY